MAPKGEGCGVDPMDSTRKTTEVGFEDAVRLLERTVEDLESGDLGLDRSLARYQEGVQLLAHCYGLLENAERVVALLRSVDADGNPETTPFAATATMDRESLGPGR